MTNQETPNHTSSDQPDTNSGLDAILAQLTIDEIRFMIARSDATTDKDAAKAIGISPNTVKGWPMERKDLIREALRYMAEDGLVTALHLRRRNLAKAMAVKVKGLESDDERLRQSVATEVIEWELGRATQPQEHSGPGGGAIEVKHEYSDDAIADILSVLAGTGALDSSAETDGEAEAQ